MPDTLSFATRFWLFMLAAFLGVLWLFKPVLVPFLAGLAIAYFLEPVVAALEKRRIPRWAGALIVLSGFLLIVALIVVLIWPLLRTQGLALLNALPEYTAKVREHYLPWAQGWLARFSPEDVEKIRDAATQSAGDAAGWVSQTVQHIVTSGFALIDAVALSILAPVTAFHVLRDWGALTGVIDSMIPRRHYALIREQMAAIDDTLSGFVRGQAMVCLILGAVYSVGLALNGLKYGATVGIVAGILTIIPYVGTVFGWVTSVILAIVQFDGDWLRVGLVVAVFAIGHFFEAYILTPRFVGQRVGLHPVWVLFALIAGVKLMGFTGVLIAVPTAAVVGVLVRFGARLYRESLLYSEEPIQLPQKKYPIWQVENSETEFAETTAFSQKKRRSEDVSTLVDQVRSLLGPKIKVTIEDIARPQPNLENSERSREESTINFDIAVEQRANIVKDK